MDEIIALCKRRGFLFPSSEIYGGLANAWDFGHYGVLLKNNLRDLWWKRFVLSRDDMVGLEASIFLNPKVWEASGHVAGFTDALIDCRNCNHRTRADHLVEGFLEEHADENAVKHASYNNAILSKEEFDRVIETKKVEGLTLEKLDHLIGHVWKIKCPNCKGNPGNKWTPVRRFNLLFQTQLGIVEGDKSAVYLRGEIAQGIFINFKNILNSMRVRIPFGIAQQGKAFRNEITMGQSVFRTLEFDLMEFEYFVHPSQWERLYEYWRQEMWKFAAEIGLQEQNLRWREHDAHERSHYSTKTMDVEYKFPYGWKEMWGIAYRTDFDLKNHTKHSGVDLSYMDPKTNERYIPHVIEPTFGLSRLTGITLADAYRKDMVNGKERVFLQFHPSIAPIKAAIFPLQKDEKLKEYAREVYENLKKHYVVEFDDAGNIGKMYRRQDEIGTPFCITVDYQSVEDKTVTIRDRDTMKQERISSSRLLEYFMSKIQV